MNSPTHRIRYRARKRNVAGENWRQEVGELEEFSFDSEGKHQWEIHNELLLALGKPGEKRRADLPVDADEKLLQVLKELAMSYNRWKTVPHASRPAARSELAKICDLASRWQSLGAAGRDELKALVYEPNDLAQTALWRELLLIRPELAEGEPLFAWMHSDAVDWPLVAEAASRAITRLVKGGDYPDTHLNCTVSALIDFYEWYMGRPPSIFNYTGAKPAFYGFAESFLPWSIPASGPTR